MVSRLGSCLVAITTSLGLCAIGQATTQSPAQSDRTKLLGLQREAVELLLGPRELMPPGTSRGARLSMRHSGSRH